MGQYCHRKVVGGLIKCKHLCLGRDVEFDINQILWCVKCNHRQR